MSRYIVMEASAHMPNNCWGRYVNLALVETDGERPKMISERARHMVRIVEQHNRLHVGKTEKCEYRRVLAELVARCAELNAAGGEP